MEKITLFVKTRTDTAEPWWCCNKSSLTHHTWWFTAYAIMELLVKITAEQLEQFSLETINNHSATFGWHYKWLVLVDTLVGMRSVQVLYITFHDMPPIRLYAWSSSDGVTLKMDSIFYSTFCSNLFECMNNEESRAAVYWTLYLWAQCIRKCNSWMIEKPIKVVIKLQMSPFSVFLPFSMGSETRCSHQLCVSLWWTHT